MLTTGIDWHPDRSNLDFLKGGNSRGAPVRHVNLILTCVNYTVLITQENELVKTVQSKMARAALGWSIADLADAAGVHRNTVANFEVGRYAGDPDTIAAMKAALEKAGIQFIEENGGGAGVRLREKEE